MIESGADGERLALDVGMSIWMITVKDVVLMR